MATLLWWWRPPWTPLVVISFLILLFFARFVVKAGNPTVLVAGEELRGVKAAGQVELEELPEVDLDGPSVPFRKTGRALLSLPSAKSDIAIVAFLDGTIYLVDSNSGKIHGSFSSGPPLSTSYQSLTDDDSDNGYLYCGDDWKLYEHSKDFGKKKLGMTADEYVNMTPIVSVDGGVTLGSNRSTGFFFDAKTGKVMSSYWTDGFQVAGGVVSNEDKSVVPMIQDRSHFEPTGDAEGTFYIVRRDYAISRYTSLRKLSWSMTVSCIEAYSCLGFDCTTSSKKLLVYPIHDANPFSLGLSYPKAFQLPETSSESEMQLQPPLIQGPLALDMLNNSQDSFSSPQKSEVNNSISISGGGAQAASLPYSNSSSVIHPSKLIQGYSAWYLIPVSLIFLASFLYKLVRSSRKSQQSNGLVKKQSTVTKKRKARKANKSNSEVIKNDFHSPQSEEAEINGLMNAQKYNEGPFLSLLRNNAWGDGRWVGKLFISNAEIAKGSNGTVVFEGIYEGRTVAVKRLVRAHHDVASKEIQNLIASDRHPNIVRWFGVEYDSDFVYLSLERCACSLNDLIQSNSDSSVPDTFADTPTSVAVSEYRIKLSSLKVANKDFELWKENGCPSSQMIKLLRDVVSGLAHLHELGIIHRDMKPQNVLISCDKSLSAKLSDMGISKRLPEDMSSLGHHATGHGSSGWQAPEQLLHGRQTRAMDLFSLGCILFFCITKGKHPFGSHFERDTNILNNRVDLFLVEHIPEAVHLFSNLLDPDPELRPKAADVLQHPLFWDSETRLSFLRDTSDRIELKDRGDGSDLLNALENIAPVAFGGKWGDKLDSPFVTDMGRYRKYNFESTRDLLRVIRNKLNHYRELPKELKEILGTVPEGFDDYFARRFPRLLIEVYKVMYRYCREDNLFRKYFKNNLV